MLFTGSKLYCRLFELTLMLYMIMVYLFFIKHYINTKMSPLRKVDKNNKQVNEFNLKDTNKVNGLF